MAGAPHILVVDDDREIRDLLSKFLKSHGYRVTAVANGAAMRDAVAESRIDLVILDVMLPGEDGLSLCRKTRASSPMPIIMLTAMGEDSDRIAGLETGADDYLAKPFNPRELLARVKAVLRRSQVAAPHRDPAAKVYEFLGWRLDIMRRQLISPEGVLTELTGGEFELLATLAEHPQMVLSRDQILDLTRGRTAIPFDRSIDIQISRLRQKIEENPREPALIKTVRSLGYVLAAPVHAQ